MAGSRGWWSVRTSESRFGWRRWQRRQAGYCEQKLVGCVVEVQVGVDGAVGGSEEDGCPTSVVEGDVGFKAGSAAGLLDDVRGRVDGQDVNPAEADACGLAGVVESFLTDKLGWQEMDRLG